ncbi:MAG: hypothetical protein EON95_10410 [Caulobacteraceae bacterium]|nr:MAG: hypothetical protein EON95_10410 [Caulobacteraceae bacterium]
MKFIVDEQLPPALATWLKTTGHEAAHIHERGLGGAADADIWLTCIEAGAVIITKDRDFALRRAATEGPTVVWIRLGNMRVGEMMRQVRQAWPQALARLKAGRAVVELP